MRFFVLLATILFLTACAETNNQRITHWQGKSVDDLTAKMGAPTSISKTPNGNTYYIYTIQQKNNTLASVPTVGVSTSGRKPVVIVQPPEPPSHLIESCTIIVEVDSKNIIRSERTAGACRF